MPFPKKPMPWELPEPGATRLDEAVRKVLRMRRGIPDFAALRRQGMVIGTGVQAQSGTFLDARFPWLLEIGDDTGLSSGVMVLTHDGSTRRHTGYTRFARVRIGKRVYVGANAIILPGTTIGDDVIVGAGSVVRGTIEAGVVVAGVPAKVLGTTVDYATSHMEAIERGPAWHSTEWPFTGETPVARREEMLAAMGDGSGYVGYPLTERPLGGVLERADDA